jgi:hypothetical protein
MDEKTTIIKALAEEARRKAIDISKTPDSIGTAEELKTLAEAIIQTIKEHLKTKI